MSNTKIFKTSIALFTLLCFITMLMSGMSLLTGAADSDSMSGNVNDSNGIIGDESGSEPESTTSSAVNESNTGASTNADTTAGDDDDAGNTIVGIIIAIVVVVAVIIIIIALMPKKK